METIILQAVPPSSASFSPGCSFFSKQPFNPGEADYEVGYRKEWRQHIPGEDSFIHVLPSRLPGAGVGGIPEGLGQGRLCTRPQESGNADHILLISDGE